MIELSDKECTDLRILPVLKQLLVDKKYVDGHPYVQRNFETKTAIEKLTQGSADSISFLKCFQENCSGVLQIKNVDATEFICQRNDCKVNQGNGSNLDSSPNQRDSVVVAGLVLFGYYYREALSDNNSQMRNAVKEYLANALAPSSFAEHTLFPKFLNEIKQPYFAISQKRGLDYSAIFWGIATKRPDFLLFHRIYGNLAVDVKCYNFFDDGKKFKIRLSEVIKASNFRKLSSGTRHWFAMYDNKAVIDFRSSCKEDGYPKPYLLPLSHILRQWKYKQEDEPFSYLANNKNSSNNANILDTSFIEVDITDHEPGTFKYDASDDIAYENFSDLYWKERRDREKDDE